MKWGVTFLTVVLVILFVLISGCSNVSLGSTTVGDFGKSIDALKAQDWFNSQYGDPSKYTGPARFVEPMVSSGVADNTPTDKVLKFNDKVPSVYFWVIYEGFNKGDSVTATWTFQGKQFATLTKQVGGNYGAINAEFDAPTSGWVDGTHTITITGDNAQNSTTFEIVKGDTVKATLPFETQPSAGTQGGVRGLQAPSGAEVGPASAAARPGVVGQGPAGGAVVASGVNQGQEPAGQSVVRAQGLVSAASIHKPNLAGTCGSDQTMKNGVCTCIDSSKTPCGADCVNLLGDPYNCGECGKSCGADQTCSGGSCQCTIGGETACQNGCVNLMNDLNNCGSCGNACPQNLPGSKCSGGSCGCVNPSLAMCIGEGCINLQSDNNNCGACGHMCPDHMICSGTGKCRCDKNNYWVNYNRYLNVDYGDYSDEGGPNNPCVNINNDPNNCGYPTHQCPANTPLCIGGYCSK